MSLASTLSSAISGLSATSRGTQIVAENLANLKSKSYARREIMQSAQAFEGSGGGVRIDGIARVINTGLLSELRLADSARAEVNVRMQFHRTMEAVIGTPGNAKGLTHGLNEFHTSLINANAHPSDTVRLAKLADDAQAFAKLLNDSYSAVQAEKYKADSAIIESVDQLNSNLERVSYLNRRIAVVHGKGADPSALIDERQSVIDRINEIIPVQVAQRDSQRVAVFTIAGATLLDGLRPVPISIKPTVYINGDAGENLKPGERLNVNGREVTDAGMSYFAGGKLSAHFEVRDVLTNQLQHELDSFALELHDRFADPKTDPTLTGDKLGLFTDGNAKAGGANMAGFASRITINALIMPPGTEKLWLLRSGLGAEEPVPAGDTAQFVRFNEAITQHFKPPVGSTFVGTASLVTRLAELESQVSTRRVQSENDSSVRNSRLDTIAGRFYADGVDTDVELQKLLQYEQSYAANARVVQAVSEMMDQILRW